MSAEVSVAPLGRTDIDGAVGTLAAAFADYPIVRAIAPDPARRPRACEAFCRMLLTYSLRRGHAHATGDRTAVACWLPPGREWLGFFGLVRSGGLALAWRIGVRRTVLLDRLGRVTTAARKRHTSGPHWYLNLLGVRPEAKGRGLSRAVLRPGFAAADRDRLPCYLDTQDAANVAIYRRLGFDLIDESAAPGGMTNYAMRRPPQ